MAGSRGEGKEERKRAIRDRPLDLNLIKNQNAEPVIQKMDLPIPL